MLNSKYGLIIILLTSITTQAHEVNLSKSHSKTNTQEIQTATTEKQKLKKPLKKPVETITIEYHDEWSDSLHDTITDSVYQSAIWFDSFFTLELNEQKHPKTSAKIRLGWLPERGDYTQFKTRFRIKLLLPNLQNRADIILSDNNEEELNNLPLDTLNRTQTFNQDSFSTALRYINNNERNKFTDTRIGFSSGDLFMRYRHSRLFVWHNIYSIKIEPAVFYFMRDGLGARVLLEYNYQAKKNQQYRISYSIRASESYNGQKWNYGFYHLHQLNDKSATLLGLVAQGRYASHNGSFAERYNFSYRYRFNALRSWLFFEVEPFLEWVKKNNFTTSPGIAFRVEGFFERG